ncbi:MAG: YqgE/AlgH family protein [Phenylobacterium sp.]|uniref:YqgE/AlgH family protein n=1 Tax=Phenylobacterium sp. TaxID=1871053 RepID=UPI002732A855|nr:YqgE/AlgH family protein [Phenylobacterium sp.]MDP3176192.1 YqgE/AlgH family protein [Phenylobacterium sp.]
MDSETLEGKLLIAMPGIGDPRFERALVLVCNHDPLYAMGVAVNQPVAGVTVPDLLRRLEVAPSAHAVPDPVLIGGPVDRERGFVLHTDDYLPEHSAAVMRGVALSPNRDALQILASPNGCPRHALLVLGYAGWGPGQLEEELRRNVWLTCEADEELIFSSDHAGKWARALAKLGVDAGLLSAHAGQA